MVLALYTVVRRARARALDGAQFRIHDVLFDDRTFELKYLVVNVGRFALSRRVVVPAEALLAFDAAREEIRVNLTREQVEHEPLAKEHAIVFLTSIAPGVFPLPAVNAVEHGEPHLWSARDLIGYSLRSGELITGHIEDVVLDPGAWKIRTLVASIFGERTRKVLIDPTAIERIHWLGATVHVSLTPDQINAAPDLILGPVEVAA